MTNDIASSSGESGFGLVEALIATVITAIGVLSVAVLMMVGARLQQNSRDGSNSWALVTAEIERISYARPDQSAARQRRLPRRQCPQPLGHARHDQSPVGHHRQAGPGTGLPALCAPVGGVEGAPLECARNISVVAITPNSQAIRAQVDSVLFR